MPRTTTPRGKKRVEITHQAVPVVVLLIALAHGLACAPDEAEAPESASASATRAPRGRRNVDGPSEPDSAGLHGPEDPVSIGASQTIFMLDERCEATIAASVSTLDPRRARPRARLALLERCLAEHPEKRSELVATFMTEVEALGSSAPPWEGGTAFVLHRGDPSRLSISTATDGWPSPGRHAFRPIAGTDLSVAEVPVGAGARVEYRLTRRHTDGSVEWLEDRFNAWVTWDGIDRGGPGLFNGELLGPDHALSRSLIYRMAIESRDVFIQLPVESLETSSAVRGIAYVHDGNEMLTRGGFQAVVDRTIAEHRAAPIAMAYVALAHPTDRDAEYTYGASGSHGRAYIDALASIIAPAVEHRIAARVRPSQRALAGASLGGLISFYGVIERNDVFQRVGAQSASLWWNDEDLVERIAHGPRLDARVYLDSGSSDDNTESNRDMAQALESRGYAHRYVVEPGALHDWPYWANRADALLEFLFPTDAE